jgi:tRNA pseudouridine55 synthase
VNPEPMRRRYRPLDGVLLFDKPLELSSNAALQKVRHLFQAEKAGHTGTLDPLATGLLPICFGEATKFSTALLDADKSYRATLQLGQKTTSGDAEGEVIETRPVNVTRAQIDSVLAGFLGEISQLPPMHSALKFQGKPLYEYIRKGETVEREARPVTIHKLLLERLEGTQLEIFVQCSKGTYVRTLAEDIGEALGCGAHLIALRRTGIAHFDLRDALDLPGLQVMAADARDARVLPIEVLMPGLPVLTLDGAAVKRLAQGQRLALENPPASGKVVLHGPQGFVGTGILEGRRLSPERLMSRVAKQAAHPENPA